MEHQATVAGVVLMKDLSTVVADEGECAGLNIGSYAVSGKAPSQKYALARLKGAY